MTERIYLLPLWIRLWHWSNAALIVTLAVTGVSVHFAAPSPIDFALAARLHSLAGLALVALYAVFLIANAVSGNWRQFMPAPAGLVSRSLRQVRYYLQDVFKGEPEPFPVTREANFNPLQAITYGLLMYLVMPVIAVTGLLFLYPGFIPDRVFGLSGLLPVAVIHYVAAAVVVLFMIVHVYLGTMGRRVTSLFKTMITGWHEH